MKAVRYHESGGPDVLTYETIDAPVPSPTEVLVEIRAAAINPVDAKLRALGHQRTPKITGSDLAGIIVEVGDEVSDFEEGDRVFATGLHTERFQGGSFAEKATVPIDLLAHLPEEIGFEEGAAIALVGVTAWRAFVNHADLEPGDSVFIHGGNGGVGHVAVGLAKAMGASIVCTARPEYHAALSKLGADRVIDYELNDFLEIPGRDTQLFDVILDHMPSEYMEFNVEIAKFGADIVNISGGNATISESHKARMKEIDIHFMSMSNLVNYVQLPNIGPILEQLAGLMVDGRLDVLIDRTYSLEEGDKAHQSVMEESILGKIVVKP